MVVSERKARVRSLRQVADVIQDLAGEVALINLWRCELLHRSLQIKVIEGPDAIDEDTVLGRNDVGTSIGIFGGTDRALWEVFDEVIDQRGSFVPKGGRGHDSVMQGPERGVGRARVDDRCYQGIS